jgi:hypothetical protein
MQRKLPAEYDGACVIGVTEAVLGRPTVYFSDYSRYTQAHRRESNLGFHPGPARAFFFGNISDDLRDAVHDHFSNVATQEALGQAHVYEGLGAWMSASQDPRGRLFELRVSHSEEYGYHPSRTTFVPVADLDARRRLVDNIRARQAGRIVQDTEGNYMFQA